MARVEIRVSDLTGEQIQDDERAARLLVEHPDYPEPIGLDVIASEITPHLTDEASRFVVVTLEDPDNPNPQRYALSINEFNDLFARTDPEEALEQAYTEQQQAQKSSRRERGGRRQQPERRERINWASPERAGLDHPGRISEREKAYVRQHLDEVNENRRQHGQPEIDPQDPEMARRYGFSDEPIADTEVV